MASDTDKQLARVAGVVQYQAGADPTFHGVFGKIDLSDAALAVTLAQSRAQLILPDSSSIDIGATTRVRLGAFNAVDTGNPNVIVLELGALHFNIKHPAGGRANYRFRYADVANRRARHRRIYRYRSDRHGFLLRRLSNPATLR